MARSRLRERGTRTWLLAIALLGAAGCASWKTAQRDELQDVVLERHPGVLRVYDSDSMYVLETPRLEADTLSGIRTSGGTKGNFAVSVARVDSVAYRAAKSGAKLVFIGIPAALALTMGVLLLVHEEPGIN